MFPALSPPPAPDRVDRLGRGRTGYRRRSRRIGSVCSFGRRRASSGFVFAILTGPHHSVYGKLATLDQHGHSSRSVPHLSLPLRPPGDAGTRTSCGCGPRRTAGRRSPQLLAARRRPSEHFLNWQQDPFGNYQARLAFPKPARELSVEVDLVAEMVAINPFDFFVEEYAEKLPVRVRAGAGAASWRRTSSWRPPGPRAGRAGRGAARDDVRAARPAQRRRAGRHQPRDPARLRYDIRMEPGVFAPEETLARGHGSCRDFAWLVVQLLRRLGFAARFVSGYSIQLRGRVRRRSTGPSGVSEDVTDLHAWAEVYLPGAGWIGLRRRPAACWRRGAHPAGLHAPMPASAAPITGSYRLAPKSEDDKVGEEFAFEMKVHAHRRAAARRPSPTARSSGRRSIALRRPRSTRSGRAATCG